MDANILNSDKELFLTRNEDIDEILRGEMSAKDAYEQVIAEVHSTQELEKLIQFKSEHEKAVIFWQNQARFNGSLPNIDPGIWGSVVDTFIGISKIAGEGPALMALKKGEEYGLNLYKKSLKSKKLSTNQKRYIREEFVPKQRRHIEIINAMIENNH